MSYRNQKADDISEAIRQVSIRDWDPIGVMDDPEWPQDEYDSYIGEIYRFLSRGEPADFIASHLCLIEEKMMGLVRVPDVMLEKMVSPDDLLEQVVDKQTFIKFVQALAEERERAQEIENKHPNIHVMDGALGWKNGDIPSFLSAALECFTAQPVTYSEQNLSWKMFAEFLYFGKIYE